MILGHLGKDSHSVARPLLHITNVMMVSTFGVWAFETNLLFPNLIQFTPYNCQIIFRAVLFSWSLQRGISLTNPWPPFSWGAPYVYELECSVFALWRSTVHKSSSDHFLWSLWATVSYLRLQRCTVHHLRMVFRESVESTLYGMQSPPPPQEVVDCT